MQEQLFAQLTQELQTRVGLSPEQSSQAISVVMEFAQQHLPEIAQTYGPQLMQSLNSGQAGGLLDNLQGLFGGGQNRPNA